MSEQTARETLQKIMELLDRLELENPTVAQPALEAVIGAAERRLFATKDKKK